MELRQDTTLFNNRYKITSCIGSGGFGITYLGIDNQLGRQVVLKEFFPKFMVRRDLSVSNQVVTLGPDYSDDYNKGLFRFLSEAKTLALLDEVPEIASVYDFFQENGTAYIVMEYIKGKNLKQIIKERTNPFSFDEAITLIRPCLEALQKVHEAGLIHRDFTPDNIIINEKGRPKIIDFGSSRDYKTSEATMTIMVKHGYAPIEQYSNDVKQGTYTDVYSISAIIYEMVTLNKPASAIERLRRDPLVLPSSLNNSISDAENAVIMKGLAVDYEDRFATIKDLLDACDTKSVPVNNASYNNAVNTAVNGNAQNPGYTGNYTNNQSYSMNESGATEVLPQSAMNNSGATEVLAGVQYNAGYGNQNYGQNYAQNNYNYSQAGNYAQNPGYVQAGNYQGQAMSYGYQVGTQGMVSEQVPVKKSNSLRNIIIALVAAIVVIAVIITSALYFTGNNTKNNKKVDENSNTTTNEDNVTTNTDMKMLPGNGKVGISLPTTDSYRWINDGNLMKNELSSLGYEVDIQYAQYDVQAQVNQVKSMIDSGCDCLIIAAIDSSALVNVEKQAKEAGIPVIAYDRLLMDTDAVSYYVTFNQVGIGRQIGEYIVENSGATPSNPKTVELFMGSPDDNNAHMLYQGLMEQIQPLLDSGALVCKSGQLSIDSNCTLRWDQQTADKRCTEILSKYYNNGDLDICITAYDGLAYGCKDALENEGYGLEDWPLITGQDAEVKAVKNIISGKQTMTVLKDTRILVESTVGIVTQVLNGKSPEVNDTSTYNNGVIFVPTLLCNSQTVDINNYKKLLIDSGYYTESDLQ